MNYRIERINSEIAKCLTVIIRDKVKDPRVSEMVSITRVSAARDLKTAKVFVSIYGQKDKVRSTFEALVQCEGFIRHELSLELKHLRCVPQITFEEDTTGDYGQRIDSLIREIKEHDNN
ncbi:MAG: 30S ribosome-binding factor RbfA [Clostridia bacterium]|nr:30S ribosome-binding factor RbfA [Clostridia bacterium]